MCCSSFLKVMMFVFNGIIFLAGVAILGVGIWVRVDGDSLLELVGGDEASSFSLLVNASYAIIAVGAVLLVIGFLGCCGAVRENRCMLLTFFSIVLIIFLIEVAGAVMLFVFRDFAGELLQELQDEVREEIRNKYGTDSAVTSLWNDTMRELQCCGFSNYTDFTDTAFNINTGGYPQTCCNTTSPCSESAVEISDVPGCFEKLLEIISNNSVIIAAVALGIAALEIAAMVVSMVLYCKAGEKARNRYR